MNKKSSPREFQPEKTSSRESQPAVTTELIDHSTQSWGDIKGEILELEDECFGGQAFPESKLESIFNNPESIIVLLKREGKIIGFSSALPDRDVEGAVYIYTTEIHPDEQGKGLVTSIVSLLENEARKRGYKFLTRNAAIGNGYAGKIQKNYEGRILETYENDSEYGPQRYFKIAL